MGNLIDLRAVEASETIELAFANNWVEEEIVGDWSEVQLRLEGKEPPPRPPTERAELIGRLTEMMDRLGGPSGLPPGFFASEPSSDLREQRRDKRRRQRRRRHRQ